MSSQRLTIRDINPSDASQWLTMRCALWPGDDDAHAAEIASFFDGQLAEPQHVLFAELDQTPVGFAELSIREDIPDCLDNRLLTWTTSMSHPRIAVRQLPEVCFKQVRAGRVQSRVWHSPAIVPSASLWTAAF